MYTYKQTYYKVENDGCEYEETKTVDYHCKNVALDKFTETVAWANNSVAVLGFDWIKVTVTDKETKNVLATATVM